MNAPLRLEIIVASNRPDRFADVPAGWLVTALRERPDFEVGVLDLRELGLPADLTESPATEGFRARLATADAIIAVTSEYNHGYPAALKTALDSAKHEWRAKPIGFVSYGGLSGGLRAVEQLRQVVAELHMVSVRESVSFAQAKRRFDKTGMTDDDAAIDACDRMLNQLAWWGTTLRAARTVEPYPG
ncbi:NADPH-dependent FMN reductase [Nocardia sp. NPDC058658]|uniref:NADPH-dependent FMN reductase n=1 Tax=Nocardia sp. NPDC058658 TaxID=3346580 RepID=UPI003667D654